MTRARYLEGPVREDLGAKMVFVAGPRQVGKTTLARQVLAGWEPAPTSAGTTAGTAGRSARPAGPVAARSSCWTSCTSGGLEGVAQGRVRQAPRAPALPRHRQRSPRRLPAGRRLAAGTVPPPSPAPVLAGRGRVGGKAGQDPSRAGARHRAEGRPASRRGAAAVRRVPGAVPRPVGADACAAGRRSGSIGSSARTSRPRAHPRPLQLPAAGGPPARDGWARSSR